MSQPWPSHVQERLTHIYYEDNKDVFVLHFKDGAGYAAIPRMDPLMLDVMFKSADIVYYVSQRLKGLDI